MQKQVHWLGLVVAGLLMGPVGLGQDAPPDRGPTYRVLRLPKVRVEPAAVNFGDVRPRKKVSQQVHVFNESDVPLRIAHTMSTCKCTVATPAQDELGPGESVALTITLDTGELTGEVSRYIQVQFEGGARPLLIGARAYVSEGIRIETQYAQPDRDDLYVVELREATGEPFRVLDVSGTAPVYVDDAADVDAARADHRLRVKRGLDDPRHWVAIATDHPDAALVMAPLDADAIGDVEVRPTWIFSEKRLVARELVAGEAHEIVVNLRGIGAKEQGDIDSARTLDDRLHAHVAGADADGPFAVDLRVALTPRSDVRGLVHTVLEIAARGFTQTVDLIVMVDGAGQIDSSEEASFATEASFDDAEPVQVESPPVQEEGVPVEQGVDEDDTEDTDEEDDDGWAPIMPPSQGASRS